jgi:hypothetical protein
VSGTRAIAWDPSFSDGVINGVIEGVLPIRVVFRHESRHFMVVGPVECITTGRGGKREVLYTAFGLVVFLCSMVSKFE